MIVTGNEIRIPESAVSFKRYTVPPAPAPAIPSEMESYTFPAASQTSLSLSACFGLENAVPFRSRSKARAR